LIVMPCIHRDREGCACEWWDGGGGGEGGTHACPMVNCLKRSMSITPTWPITAAYRSGLWLAHAATNRPPLLPPCRSFPGLDCGGEGFDLQPPAQGVETKAVRHSTAFAVTEWLAHDATSRPPLPLPCKYVPNFTAKTRSVKHPPPHAQRGVFEFQLQPLVTLSWISGQLPF